jgi:hypothetical protein
MRCVPLLALFPCITLAAALRADGPPTAEDELARLAGSKECATWELQLTKNHTDQSLKRVSLTFHRTRLGASVTPIYVATLAVEHANGSVERGFTYQLDMGPKGRFVVGSKGAVLDAETRIPYTLEGGVLELGEATAMLPKIGKLSLRGRWKKVGEK